MKSRIDTCLTGYGVSCGAEVHLTAECTIVVADGTVILQTGDLYHIAEKQFRYYVKPDKVNRSLMKFILSFLKLHDYDPGHPIFFQLAKDTDPQGDIDSLKQQHPDDFPEHNLLWNKILLLVVLPAHDDHENIFWVMVSRNALAAAMEIGITTETDPQDIFSGSISRQEIDIRTIDERLRPVLKLPQPALTRVGYAKLAITKSSLGLRENNLHHPYKSSPADYYFDSFTKLFFEYKEIIDKYILILRDALKLMHDNFGPLLSHKGAEYLKRCREILMLKRKRFYEEGEHLYYIQYFYDWLRDLTTAYNELVILLNGFKGGCPCAIINIEDGERGNLVMLGPVLGGRTTYSPLIFRDLALPADKDNRIRELRCMHWRLMMMIRTFDLPFLRLEKALKPGDGGQGIEEELDSTDYWEYLNENSEPHAGGELNWLPIKFTPTRSTTEPLGRRAIPYYYPIDGNSIYSVHQYWEFIATVLRREDAHLSYNAHEGDTDLPSTHPVNDSYTSRHEVLMPLVYDLEPFHWLRPEGHIGKKITVEDEAGVRTFYFKSFPLHEYLEKYNLCVDVIAIGLPGSDTPLNLEKIPGLEHRPALQQGQTLVLFFVDAENEQIELQECLKDEKPEIKRNVVVADFVLPYRYSVSPVNNIKAFTLVPQPI